MKIGYVQNAPVFGEKNMNFKEIKTLLIGAKADLIVLSELFATGYTLLSREEAEELAEDKNGTTSEFLVEIAETTGATIVAGFIEREGDKIYNSSLMVSAEGTIDTYRKLHLFNKEKLWFDPGNKPFAVYDVEGVKVGIMICYDWIFPEATRTLALLGADLVAHPANLVLPYCQQAMITRCLENRVFAVTANRIGREIRGADDFSFTGASQITAFNGEVLASAPINETALHIVEIDPEKARNKMINEYNNVFTDRRLEFYGESSKNG